MSRRFFPPVEVFGEYELVGGPLDGQEGVVYPPHLERLCFIKAYLPLLVLVFDEGQIDIEQDILVYVARKPKPRQIRKFDYAGMEHLTPLPLGGDHESSRV